MTTAKPARARSVDLTGRSAIDDKRQLSEKVAMYVRERIMIGEFHADDFLRTERLAEQLGVSATPVREALMLLHSEGSVRWEPRRGYRIVPLTQQDVSDLFDVQAHIAGELAARAAEVLDESEIARLEDIQAKLEEAAKDGEAELVDEYNHEIHRTINKASNSTRMRSLLSLTVQYVPLNYFGTIEGWAQASAHDHSAIFTALRERDPETARTVMSEHIRHIGELLAKHLRKEGNLS
ncbi:MULTISPECIES: GntR family transcriptional regulator [unclassified Streptomyces]|uniref:GntR family transcriptional regulator n=1 Tax=unclassified Streptomyces TaxID=2593676 RepID=UPI003431DD6A